MNIFIIGAGFTGVQLAKRLINEKNNVTLIDNDEEICRHAQNRLDCSVIHADGNNLEVLEANGIAQADTLVTVTDNDEINMITCSLVDAVYPDILKIARVRNYAYYVNTETTSKHHAETFAGNHRPLYGIDYMIHPDVEAAETIVRAVEHGAVSEVVSFGDDDYELTALSVEPGCKIDGIALKNIRQLTEQKLIVVFVESKQGGSFLPSGETIIHSGDRIGVLISKNDIRYLLDLCGAKVDSLKKICIVGAGRIGTIVADHLIEKNKQSLFKKIFGSSKKLAQDIVIVDTDDALVEQASARYPDAKVFCADITDDAFIQEEGLDKFNLIITTSHNHELNLVVAAYFESLGVEKTISLVSHSAFGEIARKLGVSVTVPLRDAVVDSIISHLRGKSVTGIHTVCNGEFEIVEFDLPSTSKYAGKTLKDISNPGHFLVLLIKKRGAVNYEIPGGNTTLSIGDHLVIIQSTGDKKIMEHFNGVKSN